METKAGSLTEAQQVIRATGVGASEVAAIVGKSKWATPIDVYRSKTEPRVEAEELEVFKRGRHLEAAVLGWYEEEVGAKLERQPTLGTLRSKDFPHVVATPDAFDRARGISVQAKTHRFDAQVEYGAQGTDQIPQHELIQVTMEMGVLGVDVAHLPVLFGGDEFRIYHVPFSRPLFVKLGEAVEAFWENHVAKRVPPPIDGSPGYAEFLASIFATRKTQVVKQASPEDADAIAMLKELRGTRTALEEREMALKNQLRLSIGEDYGLQAESGRALWTGGAELARTNWKELAEALSTLVPADRAATLVREHTVKSISPRQLRLIWGAK